MKIRKRWISLCLAIILLAGIAFNPGSIAGNYVEAANLEETGEAVSEENTQTDNTAAVLSETDTASAQTESTETVMTETPAEDTTATETPVEETQIETPVETPAPETTEISTPAVPAENVETTTDTEQAVTEQPETTVPTETETSITEETSDNPTEEAVQPSAYEGKYEDDSVIISVSAEPGIVPEGAQLSVTPIEKTEITNDMTAEEAAEAEQINAQYDLTEKKLTEDSEKNEETMEGFLAYDISFIVNGVEVEPSGDVKVTMDFKQAAIPEGVSEDAEISVKHLKEDVTAEDGVVVEDMDLKSNIQTTVQAEVQKVELTAESFSIFTITWENSSRNYIRVYYVDETGKEIDGGREQKVNIQKSGESAVLEDYAVDIDGYSYKGAHVDAYNGMEVASIKYTSNPRGGKDEWTYKRPNDNTDKNWRDNGGGKVYLVYEKIEELTTVPTVDSASKGITISMFDYGGPKPNDSWGGYGNGTIKTGLLNKELQ